MHYPTMEIAAARSSMSTAGWYTVLSRGAYLGRRRRCKTMWLGQFLAGGAVMQTAGVTPRVESTNAAASVAPTTVAAALCQTPDTVGNDLEADWLASNYQQVDAAAPDVLRHYQECVSATSGERHYYFERQLAYFEGIAADTAVNFTRFSEACSRFETAISLLNDVIRNTTLSAARANAQGLLDQIQPTYDTHCAR